MILLYLLCSGRCHNPLLQVHLCGAQNLDLTASYGWHDRFDIMVDILQPPSGLIGGVLGSTWLATEEVNQIHNPVFRPSLGCAA